MICENLPDACRQAGVRGVTLLLWSLAEVRQAAADHRLPLVKHRVQTVVGQLDEDEEDGDGSTVDAQGHGGGRQSLWRIDEPCHIQISIPRETSFPLPPAVFD